MSLATDVLQSSSFGVAFSFVVQTMTYPMDVVKFLQQDPSSEERCYQVAKALFKKEGLYGFYKGFIPRICEISLKQVWCWPMITGLPPFFKRYGFTEPKQQALTALSISTVDAFLGTPLDYLKLRIIYGLETGVSWRGFPTNFARRFVGWTTFLVAQNHFGKKYRIDGQKLTYLQSALVAFYTASLVSLAGSPFDVLNTMWQTNKKLSLHFFRRMYRGFPLSFSALFIQNLSSVILIDKLKSSSYD